ncbi:hypothetical protein IT413_03955 [Candidatus Peregrinibacteria bacterium]|nr:hypothetical protein [Candidatus Peregrinibacteria bacterium]
MTTSRSSVPAVLSHASAPPAPDSISGAAANAKTDKVQQLKRHWATASADTLFPQDQLEALCLALQNRGPQNKSRLEYTLKAVGEFAAPHARVCTLTFLLHDYASRRAGSAAANEKWVLAKRGVLTLRESLPKDLQNAPIFSKLEGTSDSRPRKPVTELSWRDR